MAKSAQQLLDEFREEYKETSRIERQETDLKHLIAEIHRALSEIRSEDPQRIKQELSRILLCDENDLRLINNELAYGEVPSGLPKGVRIAFRRIGIRIKEEGIEILRLDEVTMKRLRNRSSKRYLASALSKMERLAVIEFRQADRLNRKLRRDLSKRKHIRNDPIEPSTGGQCPYKLKDPKVIEMFKLDQETAEYGMARLAEYIKRNRGVPLVRDGRYNAVVARLFKSSISLKAIRLGYRLIESPEFIAHPDDQGFDYPDKFAFFWFFQHCSNANTMRKGIRSYEIFIKYLQGDMNPRITPDIRHKLLTSFMAAMGSTRRYLNFQTNPRYQRLPLEFSPTWATGDWVRLERLIIERKRIPTFKP